jgi:hypothetical protein
MKKLFKIILPPIAGFAVFFGLIKLNTAWHIFNTTAIDGGLIDSLVVGYRYLFPLLFTVAVLTQALIIVPVWRSVIDKPSQNKIRALVISILVCFLFASGMGYTIWDTATGTIHLFKAIGFMFMVQLLYWAVNLAVLKLIR